ncbi:MAG: DTW domain-containing protein, partial [Pseudomonadota bacterium]
MNLKDYLDKRKQFSQALAKPRINCRNCRLSLKTCYCHQIKKFDPGITFVILIHKLEIKRKIATGHMAHLTLGNSLLLKGHDYSDYLIINK